MRPEVAGQVVDAVRQQGHLDLGRAGVRFVLAKILDDLFGCLLGLQDLSPSSFSRSLTLVLWIARD
jgi:hypothetical protein